MPVRRRAFTLLEMLVALGVFAVIGFMSSQILAGIVDLSGTVRERSDRLAELQRAVFIIGRDIEQLVHRPVRDVFGDPGQALSIGEPLIELTRGGWQNPLQAPCSALQRVAYAVEEGVLVRKYWPVLDGGPGTEPIAQALLSGVQDLEFIAHAHVGSIDAAARGAEVRYWPPESGQGSGAALRAVEMRLDHEAYGRLVRVWAVPQSSDFLAERGDVSGPDDAPSEDDAPSGAGDDRSIDTEAVF